MTYCFLLCFLLILGNNIQDGENEQVEDGEELKDNRALVDNNTAQSLTGDDIDEMRR